jgi:hypothetical protein
MSKHELASILWLLAAMAWALLVTMKVIRFFKSGKPNRNKYRTFRICVEKLVKTFRKEVAPDLIDAIHNKIIMWGVKQFDARTIPNGVIGDTIHLSYNLTITNADTNEVIFNKTIEASEVI